MDGKGVEGALAEANAIMGQFLPLIGIVGATATLLVSIARKVGADPADLEAELTRMAAARADVGAAIAEFNAKYGAAGPQPDAAAQQGQATAPPRATPPDPGGPPRTAGARTPTSADRAKDSGPTS